MVAYSVQPRQRWVGLVVGPVTAKRGIAVRHPRLPALLGLCAAAEQRAGGHAIQKGAWVEELEALLRLPPDHIRARKRKLAEPWARHPCSMHAFASVGVYWERRTERN